jgi:transcriptional regulator with XRE-family HTH domain
MRRFVEGLADGERPGAVDRESQHASQEPQISDAPMISEVNVGSSARKLRVRRGLSIRQLAQQSGISVNTLSLIENGRTSPTVSTLQQLAAALGLSVAAFFETGVRQENVVYVKSGQRRRVTFDYGTIENLGAGFINSAVEPFVVTLEAGAGSGPQATVHTGYEFVLCLRGRIVYRIDDRTYLLRQGDSLLLESHLPHCWHNVENKPSEFLLVLSPTDTNDRATDRHFTSTNQRHPVRNYDGAHYIS